jgi:hypothetical protein
MFFQNHKKIDDKIRREQFSKEDFMSLEISYEKTVEELGLQQTKRDQIIALYLSILGFVIPSIINLNVSRIAKGAGFFVIYLIGFLFCRIVIRYRIYKEVYWIACRVISQLYNIKPEERNKETVQTLFFRTLKKNAPSVVIKNKKGKASVWRSFKKQLNSAEMTLFNILLLFTSFIGGISVTYLFRSGYLIAQIISGIIAALILFIYFRLNRQYVTSLLKQYKCVDSNDADDLSIPFNKAWMLHCYVDDDEFNPNNENN